MSKEKRFNARSGWLPLFVFLAFIPAAVVLFSYSVTHNLPVGAIVAVPILFTGIIGLVGLLPVAPNQARVLLLFGVYRGSVTTSGFYWVNPFFSKKKISLRVRNFETGSTSVPEEKNEMGKVLKQESRTSGRPSKVNDRDGNPIDISAVVVWKVVDTAEAMFEVDDYRHFVATQSESALRNLATRHPYDSEDHEISLRGSTQKISEQLRQDIQARLDKAGVEVIEAQISHLAYASEIAAAMLQRQQAQAVVAARTKIVEGAVGMVRMALAQLSEEGIVNLDEERRAQMVSNLLVVLCSDRATQPVVNTGSLY